MARVVGIVLMAGAIALTVILLRPDPPADLQSTPPLQPASAESRIPPLDDVVTRRPHMPDRLDPCGDPDTGKSDEQRVEELQRLRGSVLPVLRSSTDAEHLMAAALMSSWDDSDDALLLLGQAAANDPRDPLVASQILGLCIEVGSCAGARVEMEQNLIAADRGNSLAWVQVSRSRLKRGDEDGALKALRQAASSTELNGYFVEYTMAFDRALAASSGLAPYERIVAALGFGAAVPFDTWLISRDCNDRAAVSAEWRDACLRLGEKLEHDGRTLLSQSVGLGIQISMYKLEGDTRPLEQALVRQKEFKDGYQLVSSQSNRAIELRDATMVRKYFEIFAANGELEAMQYLADEVAERLPPDAGAENVACQTP